MKGRQGFTIVETVVAVAITALLLSFILPAFLSTGRIYRDVVEANMLYVKSLHTVSFLKDSVQDSAGLRIMSGAPYPRDGYSAIWCEGDKLYYQKNRELSSIYMQDTRFALDFSGSGSRLGIRLQILTDGEPYVLETAVALRDSSEIDGKNGTGIQFKTTLDTIE